tara:strand:+ start:405 stop:989 length:585 start_codon:yes stop_codon:yes gene_type:complete
MKNNTEDKKKDLRKKQLILRKNLSSSITKVFVQELFEKLFEKINFNDLNIISSFNSINTEINTIELNEYIIKNNKILCFPVITNKNDHLVFRKFTNYNDMTEGFMKIKEPSKRNPTLFPQLLFVPCLAYDKDGYRLGYGGGYYDKTFAYLKKNNRKFISVGYAFDDQVVLNVPKDKFDIKLDYVITEKKFYSFL